LRGTGFNYDFADDEGPGRDLRTGKPLEGKKPAIPLIKVGDLLITTGFDGVFPAGLQAARVSKIFPLKEGDYYYDIEALPSENHLDELSLVFVLQPQGYDPEDLPNEEYTLK
jgi:cell shape-determining protein MreC